MPRSYAFALAAALALAAGCATRAAVRPPAPDHPLMVQAEQALLDGREDEALRLYRAYRLGFTPSPLASECLIREGTLLLKRGRAAEAESCFRGALGAPRARHVEVAALIGLGDCRFVLDDYAGAADAYQRALDRRVPDARNDYALYRLGVARQRLGEWETGRACYDLILRAHPKSPLALQAEQRLRYPDRSLYLQAGAFQAEEGARRLESALHRKGLLVRTVNLASGPAPYVVWVGGYPTFAAAQAAMPRVKDLAGGEVRLVP